MKIFNVLGFIISIILGFVSFYATSSFYVGGGVMIFSLVFFYVCMFKGLKNHINLTNKIHQCYLFINNFLVSMSIKKSLNAGFEATSNAISDDFKEYMESIQDLNPQEKLLYLNKYFPFHVFKLFTNVAIMWQEEGGDILEMSSHVSNQIRQIEEYTTYCQSINKRKALELGVLWIFSLIIVISLRIALTDFYEGLVNQPVFVGSVVALMLVVLFSTYLLYRKVIKLEIRGISNG